MILQIIIGFDNQKISHLRKNIEIMVRDLLNDDKNC